MFLIFWFLVGVVWLILGKQLDIDKIALNPLPVFLDTDKALCPKKVQFFKKFLQQFGLGLDHPLPWTKQIFSWDSSP